MYFELGVVPGPFQFSNGSMTASTEHVREQRQAVKKQKIKKGAVRKLGGNTNTVNHDTERTCSKFRLKYSVKTAAWFMSRQN